MRRDFVIGFFVFLGMWVMVIVTSPMIAMDRTLKLIRKT